MGAQEEGITKAKLINKVGEKTFAIVFDKGDEVMSGLLAFAKANDLMSGHFTAIGAFSHATLGFFDREKNSYKKIPVNEQVEVLALVGDIAMHKNEPKVHAHVVVGKVDGTAHGGHILEAHVWPTLEVILVQPPAHLQKRTDEETGLALISL